MGTGKPSMAGAVLAALAIVVPAGLVAVFVAFIGGMEGFAAADGGRPSSAGGYFLAAAVIAGLGLAAGITIVVRQSRRSSSRKRATPR
ncbi:hypothetical protein ACTG9Q_15125 [Actinokineospora sp. 24-640]